MDIFLLERYHKLKLPVPPPFYDKESQGYIEIIGPRGVIALNKHMGGNRNTVTTQYRYMIMLLNYKLFLDGLKPKQAWDHFEIPVNTAGDHFAIFKTYPRHLK